MFKDKYSTLTQNKPTNRVNSFKEKSSFRQSLDKKFVMNEIEFPSISTNNEKEEEELKTTKPNYLEKIKTEQQILETHHNIEPGWVEIQYNLSNNTKSIHYEKSTKKQIVITQPTFVDVLEKLNKQYMTWKNNYIEMWGEEEYDFLYTFPNYDYNYYDKLDENIMEDTEYTQYDEYE